MTVVEVEVEVSEALEQFSIDGLLVTRLGLELPEDLPFDQWEMIGRKLRSVERAIQWLIGDWLRFGERKYGEMYSQALDVTGSSYQTLANQVYVAGRFEISRRRENLTFTHHAEVAGLPPEEADDLLDRADPSTNDSGEAIPVAGLRQMVRNHNLRRGRQVIEGRPGSVVENDAEALVTLIGIHARPNPRIVDVTHNDGTIWVGTAYAPTRVDVDPQFRAMGMCDITADCRELPFDGESYDVVVFDPPHITDAGDDSIMGLRYGTLPGENIGELFAPFLSEANRILSDGGIVIAKICDQVHAQHQQWQHVDFIMDAEDAGFTACDMMVRVRRGDLGGEWHHIYHVRKQHVFWIVLRKGLDNCQRLAQSGQPTVVVEGAGAGF